MKGRREGKEKRPERPSEFQRLNLSTTSCILKTKTFIIFAAQFDFFSCLCNLALLFISSFIVVLSANRIHNRANKNLSLLHE